MKIQKTTLERLESLVGKEIVRIGPAIYNNGVCDYSYSSDKVKLIEVTKKGTLIIKDDFIGVNELPNSFTDSLWRPITILRKGKTSRLNALKGKQVKRKVPTCFGDKSFTSHSVKMLHATRHHVVVEYELWTGENVISILDKRYAKSDDWYAV